VQLSINEIQSAINTNLKLLSSIIIDNDGYTLVQRNRKTSSPVSVLSPELVTSFSPISLTSKSKSSPLMFEPNMLQKLRNDFNKSPTFEKVKPNISKKVLKKENAQKNKEKVLKSKENILNKNSKDDSENDSNSDSDSDSNYDYDSDEDYNSKFWSKK
jgi:hypothetical protein